MSPGDDEKPNGAHLNGTAPELESEPDTEPEDAREPLPPLAAPTPASVAELSASCARFVLAKYKVPLDGTSDTLSILDQYIRDARADLEIQPAGLPLLVGTVGAYFGEVLRRAFDASWYAVGEHDAWRLDFHDVFLTFNLVPIGEGTQPTIRTTLRISLDDSETVVREITDVHRFAWRKGAPIDVRPGEQCPTWIDASR